MNTRRALLLAVGVTLWSALWSRTAVSQLFPPQPARYLLTTEAHDGRALWVNPAGLARRVEASIGADLTVDRSGGTRRLSQFGLTVASRNLAFGWVHDRYAGGGRGDTYALGVGLGDETFSAGGTRRWRRGGARFSTWDVALRAAPRPALQLSLVWRHIGSSAIRDSVPAPTLVPAAALSALGGRLQIGAEWEVADDFSRTRLYRVGGTLAVWRSLLLTLQTDRALGSERGVLAVAVRWEGPRMRSTLFGVRPEGGGALTAGAAGMLAAAPPRRRRR